MTGAEIAQDSAGWWVPAPASSVASRYQRAATETLAEVYRHCTGFKTALTAGAHVGVWPRALIDQFDKVIAVEPDPVNWQCLSRNLADENRVILLNSALSNKEGQAPWARSNSNTGKHKIDPKGTITVDMITIDSLDLPACDLICLDVEGYEFKALQGANATVADFSPVILFEDIGHGKKYGIGPTAVQDWLGARGYQEAARVFDDRIWVQR